MLSILSVDGRRTGRSPMSDVGHPYHERPLVKLHSTLNGANGAGTMRWILTTRVVPRVILENVNVRGRCMGNSDADYA
jgi:hypothetical protein